MGITFKKINPETVNWDRDKTKGNSKYMDTWMDLATLEIGEAGELILENGYSLTGLQSMLYKQAREQGKKFSVKVNPSVKNGMYIRRIK